MLMREMGCRSSQVSQHYAEDWGGLYKKRLPRLFRLFRIF